MARYFKREGRGKGYEDVTREVAALRAELDNMGDAVNVVDDNYREATTALSRANERARRAEAERARIVAIIERFESPMVLINRRDLLAKIDGGPTDG